MRSDFTRFTPSSSEAIPTALRAYLTASDPKEAVRLLDRLDREFVDPLVKATLGRELRRGRPATQEENFAENEAFVDLRLEARANVAQRLETLRTAWQKGDTSETISHVDLYVATVARNACVDYLRAKYPGRHSLDVSLRAALDASATFALWRHPLETDLEEWRCGIREWIASPNEPVSLRFNPDLQQRLRGALSDRDSGETLVTLFMHAGGPLRFAEVVWFLAGLWDVEAPYRIAEWERVPFRVVKPYITGLQPEEAADYYGTLQSVWAQMQALTPVQFAVLLLKSPQTEGGSTLSELVRLGIATWDFLAMRLNLPAQTLQTVSPDLPLDDARIAELIGIGEDTVRRNRQDARRKLLRQQESEKNNLR